MADYINVTSLNRLAKRVLEQCDPLNDLIVCGEISGFTRHYKSGHLYFTLKDENASIKTVMFRSQAQLLNFEPQNGMLVLVYGRATIYERDGAFQLYADYMKPFGAGAAQMAFDALYKKLEAEGLFAPERKRPLPAVPRCIGVVTSKTGAAWQDVQNVIGRRWPPGCRPAPGYNLNHPRRRQQRGSLGVQLRAYRPRGSRLPQAGGLGGRA